MAPEDSNTNQINITFFIWLDDIYNKQAVIDRPRAYKVKSLYLVKRYECNKSFCGIELTSFDDIH